MELVGLVDVGWVGWVGRVGRVGLVFFVCFLAGKLPETNRHIVDGSEIRLTTWDV